MEFCVDYFNHNYPRYCLPVSDRGRVAAERQERRLGRGFRRPGQPDSIWAARRGFGSFPGDNLVRHHFHADVDHAFDLCGTANWADFRVFWSEAGADEVAVASNDANSGRTAYRSTEPGAHTEIASSGEPGFVPGQAFYLQLVLRAALNSALQCFAYEKHSLADYFSCG